MTITLTVGSAPWQKLRTAGTGALPREIGGILVGYYAETGPVVTDVCVIPDPRATRIRYRRNVAAAEMALDRILNADDSELLGYLGEWHTHPLPLGPSATDIGATRQLALAGGYDVALLVVSLGAHGWFGHASSAKPTGEVSRIALSVEGTTDGP